MYHNIHYKYYKYTLTEPHHWYSANQSMLDLICNSNLTSKIKKSDKKISVQENRRTLTIKYKARIHGYNYYTWYSNDEIANIIYLNNMISQYRVTYQSDHETFIVHREASALSDMKFRMHKSGQT